MSLIAQGDYKFFWNIFVKKIYSVENALGFRLDLEHGLKARKALIPISIRESIESDNSNFLDNRTTGLIERLNTCYVAVNKDDVPCFRCWLIDSSQNQKLKSYWGYTFPTLSKDEMLIENVFTNPKFRGLGIFPAVLYQISDLGKKLGAKHTISFGEISNKNTTRSMAYAGFKPYTYRQVKWFLFRKRVTFSDIPDYLMKEYFQTIKGIQ
ncbi:hypothetical protein [Arenibacter sp. H213]|uniref:N-acetyltransferase domain-containing protein n=1 Tax=Arenibacter antarcticus TaxID=2040469 RepID=A0ABW5VHB8_9FLAO|nr:hypothetical protein [Arenibacter sp. H213]